MDVFDNFWLKLLRWGQFMFVLTGLFAAFTTLGYVFRH